MEGIENLPGEEWKDVPGLEGLYKISNMGRVYSLTKKILIKSTHYPESRNPYFILCHKHRKTRFNAFRIIYELFVGPISDKECIIPADDNYDNLKISNLRIISRSDLYKINRSKEPPGNRMKYKVGDILGTYEILQVHPKSPSHPTRSYTLKCTVCSETIHASKPTGNHRCSCACKYKAGTMVGKYKILKTYRVPSDKTNKIKRYVDLECSICGDILLKYPISGVDKCNIICLCAGIKQKSHYYLKDGRSNTTVYNRWWGANQRCYNKNSPHYKNYGAKGIFVCDLWNTDFSKFQSWFNAQLVQAHNKYGQFEYTNKDGKSIKTEIRFDIDRINPNGPYAPWNCQLLPSRINSSKAYIMKQRELHPETGPLRIKTDAELRKKRRAWYKEALKRGEINAKYYRKQITRLD